MVASSINFMNEPVKQKSPAIAGLGCLRSRVLRRKHVDRVLFVRPLDGELDFARDLREQRVVAADADVDSRMHPRAALAHDDAAGRNQLPPVSFYAEPLRV